MEKFTKGPWFVRETGGHGWPNQVGFAIDYNNDQEQVVDYVYEEADAQLIAAAPDMYQDIKSDIDWLEQMQGKFPLGSYEFRSCSLRIEFKRSLLAKARGEA